MRCRPVLALAAAALLALPATAGAKGIAALDVCGANGCHAVEARSAQRAFEHRFAARTPARAEPWLLLRARARVSGGDVAEVFTAEWLPRAGTLRITGGEGVWNAAGAPLAAALRRAARGLRPHPAATLTPIAGPAVARARVVEVFSPADGAPSGRGTGTQAIAALGVALAVATAFALAAAIMRRPVVRTARRATGRHA
jgi:hypothetical protein